MQRQRIELEPAYVLHARPFGDTSLLLEVFTAHRGRVGLIAKGARAPKSKKRALLQVLQPLLMSWRESGELGTLTAVEPAAAAVTLSGEPLFCAWYANELVLKLCARHEAHPVLFAAYARLLLRLVDDAEAGLRAFERVLLEELGYGLALPDDIDAGGSYWYASSEGFRGARSEDPAAEIYAGTALAALRDDNLQAAADYQAARRLLRAALRPLLAGRVLESASLLRALRSLESAEPPTKKPA